MFYSKNFGGVAVRKAFHDVKREIVFENSVKLFLGTEKNIQEEMAG